MTANFNVRKIYSAVERMDGCEYSLEIIIVLLKEHITETNFFFGNKHIIAGRIAQTMDDCKISRQTKYIIFETMDDCYSFCDKNILLKRRDGCN